MKNLILFMAVVVFVSCKNSNSRNENVSITNTEKAELRYLKEVEWPKAYREQDTLLLDRILGDDFQMIEANGNVSNKEIELDWIKKNSHNPDSFYYEIKRFDFLENGTAIVSGTGHILNDTTETIYQSSNIFIKREGNWKAVASHVSGVKNK